MKSSDALAADQDVLPWFQRLGVTMIRIGALANKSLIRMGALANKSLSDEL